MLHAQSKAVNRVMGGLSVCPTVTSSPTGHAAVLTALVREAGLSGRFRNGPFRSLGPLLALSWNLGLRLAAARVPGDPFGWVECRSVPGLCWGHTCGAGFRHVRAPRLGRERPAGRGNGVAARSSASLPPLLLPFLY